jgi:ribonuclease P protein component
MINRKHRFHGRGSLRFVYQHGKVIRSAYGSLKYVHNPRRKDYRVAIVVSRKVSKSAVVRNRIRRRLYECVRLYQSCITHPLDMVYIAYSDQLATMDAAEMRQRVWDKLIEAEAIEKTAKQPLIHAIVNAKES